MQRFVALLYKNALCMNSYTFLKIKSGLVTKKPLGIFTKSISFKFFENNSTVIYKSSNIHRIQETNADKILFERFFFCHSSREINLKEILFASLNSMPLSSDLKQVKCCLHKMFYCK